jgi:ethanolamine utilization protein EutN
MQLGRVVGHATATVKHPSLVGQRLLLLQLLTADGAADGEPVLALDHLGSTIGEQVLACNDGLEARRLTSAKTTPARWWVMGVCDR